VTFLLGITSVGILYALLIHICKVDSLSEHISSGWSFRRCYSQSLTENSNEVEHGTSVEEQEMVRESFVGLHQFSLTFSLELEDVDVVLIIVHVIASSVLDVVQKELVLRRRFIKVFNLQVQSMENIVDRVHLFLLQQSSQ
jgi:hypothetical protein